MSEIGLNVHPQRFSWDMRIRAADDTRVRSVAVMEPITVQNIVAVDVHKTAITESSYMDLRRSHLDIRT